MTVDLDDAIPRINSSPRRGRVIDRGQHLGQAVLLRDLHSKAGEFAGHVALQALVFRGIHIVGMRVETVQHALEGLVDELPTTDGGDVVLLHPVHHIRDDAEVARVRLP